MIHKTVSLTDRLYWNPWGLTLGSSFTLVLFILAGVFPTFPGDEWVLLKVQSYQAGWLTEAALGVTRLGSTQVAVSLAGAVIAGLLLLRHRIDAFIILLGVIFIAAGNTLKLAVGRPRPDYLLVDSVPTTLSFPSGHALFAVIFGGFLIFLVRELVQPRPARWGLQAGLALLVLAVGASRVYLGFHWPSDVAGGYLFGAVALLELIWLRNRLANKLHSTILTTPPSPFRKEEIETEARSSSGLG